MESSVFFLAFIASNGYFDSTASLDNPSIHPSILDNHLHEFVYVHIISTYLRVGGPKLEKGAHMAAASSQSRTGT